jgi:hypothetical protein
MVFVRLSSGFDDDVQDMNIIDYAFPQLNNDVYPRHSLFYDVYNQTAHICTDSKYIPFSLCMLGLSQSPWFVSARIEAHFSA